MKVMPVLRLMRLDKPWGLVLLAWPTLSALLIAGGADVSWRLWFIFVCGIVLTRSAGCVINDYADYRIDQRVKRTQRRPLAAGDLQPQQALVVFASLMLGCFALWLCLDVKTQILAIVALVMMVCYPYSKRIISAPQCFLGIAFTWGVPMAFSASKVPLGSTCWALYGVSVIWVIIYDTIYAMVDQDDDGELGIGSTALLLGDRSPQGVILGLVGVYLSLIWLGWWCMFAWPYFVCLLLVAYNFSQQVRLIRQENRQAYFQAFLLNQYAGLWVMLGVAGSIWFPV